MAKTLQIGSKVFEYPETGDKPGWGEEATAWAEAVTESIGNVQGVNDILITSANLNNNQAVAANINNFVFNTAQVQGVSSEFLIIRTYDAGASVVTESGTIYGNYNGSEFFITVESVGDAGIVFSITNTGQIQYTSSNLTNHVSSVIRFRARTIDQP